MKTKASILQNARRSAQIRAFTLVEVVISAGLSAIIMLSLYTGFMTGFCSIQSTREDLRATQIMVQRMEAIRLCNWTTQLSNFPATFYDYYDPSGVSSNKQGATFVTRVSTTGVATNIPDSAIYKSQVHLVTVTVNWTNTLGGNKQKHSRQMQTLVAQNGLQNYIWGNAQ